MFKDTSLLVLIIAAVGLVVNIITLIVVIGILRRFKKEAAKLDTGQAAIADALAQREQPEGQSKPASAAGAGVVFCRSCGSPYDSTNAACPQCNTPCGYRKEEGT